jgi:poly-beta-1,6-N-acetyl-D-glucosamine synthase
MRLIVVVCFLNEAGLLPRVLASIERQTRLPDRLLLVDDGSTDGSGDLTRAFARRHDFALALHRPPRPPRADRLVGAGELKAFQWAVERLYEPWHVLVKLDADLELNPRHFEHILGQFEADPALGVAGAHLSTIGPDGTIRREPAHSWHVRGPNKFYRRACYEQIHPLPTHLGWDTIDEVKARQAGWRTASFEVPGGDTLHMRPTGAHDGGLRACMRWGECAWGYGAHPLFVGLGAIRRAASAPYVAGGALYAAGYVRAALRGVPRVERDVRAFVHREEAHHVLATIRPRRALATARR